MSGKLTRSLWVNAFSSNGRIHIVGQIMEPEKKELILGLSTITIYLLSWVESLQNSCPPRTYQCENTYFFLGEKRKTLQPCVGERVLRYNSKSTIHKRKCLLGLTKFKACVLKNTIKK